MISVENVSFSYQQHNILNDITFKIRKGEVVGLIGDNGAGKSTLMKVMCGIREADKGQVKIACKRVGALIEEPAVYPKMTVKGNMEFFTKLYGASKEKCEEIMELIGLNRFAKEKANRLSVGMKKRLGLGIALLSSEKAILLDEPTSGLDPSGIRDTLNLIRRLAKEKQISFLISSHIFQDLESVCDTYYRLKDGKLANIYDRESVYGYMIEKDGMRCENLAAFLRFHNCQYKVERKNVYVQGRELTRKMIEELEREGIEITRRKLAEVYYEG